MDSYYTSPSSSYYYPTSCPLHDSPTSFIPEPYHEGYYPYAPQSTPTHPSVSYYYPSYTDSSPPPMPIYNTMAAQYSQTNYCIQPSAPLKSSQKQQQPTSTLNSTFELAPPSGRRRRQRTIFSKDQVDILDQVFEKNQYPDIQLREQLSERLDVPEARIQVWFKNRRSRARTSCKSKFQDENY